MATIHDITAYRKAPPSATTPPIATCPASPPGWLGAIRSAPIPPRAHAWSAPQTPRWSCWGGATWPMLPVQPTKLLAGSPPASAARKPGAVKAPHAHHHTQQTGEQPCPVSPHIPCSPHTTIP